MCGYVFDSGMGEMPYEDFLEFIREVEGDFIPTLLNRVSPEDCYEKWGTLADVVVCRCGGRVIGLCSFYANDGEQRRAYISFIAVLRKHRGRGIASAMLRQAARIAANKGMERLGIHTNSEAAYTLYTTRHDFRLCNATPVPEEGYVRYYMEKELNAMSLNILLTSAGRRTYLVHYFKDALKGKGMVHASNSIMTYTLTQADKYVITPGIYDDGYIDFLLDYCRQENISAIIPLFDIDLPVLASNQQRFDAEGVRLIVSPSRVTSICNDKWETYLFLKSLGCVQPHSFLSLDEAERALAEGTITFPLFLKPRWGMGSIGVYQAENADELRVFYQKVQRDIFKTYLRFEAREAEDSCVLIQEKIAGSEYGLDVLNDLSGNYVTTIAKKKIAMRAGETDVACIVDNAPFEAIGRLLSTRLSHTANLDVDCFLTDSGDIFILELNCRFGGQYPFSHCAGADFPRQIIAWLEGKGNNSEYFTPRIGTQSVKELVPTVFHP